MPHKRTHRNSHSKSVHPGLGIDRRHAIIRAILDHAVIGPGTPGARTLDLTRVQPQWRL